MAFATSSIWEVRTGGDDTNNGGGFDPGNANFATDLAATVATGNSPVVTSASYNFVAGDVNAWVYIKSGTNWTPGWYKIASVAANAATLSAAIGAALQGGAGLCPGGTNTVAGCATTASPTSGTWGVDYSQQDAAALTFTDMVIGATTTQFTSVANPVGKNFVGNVISVTSGTGFSVQRVQIVSTSTITATCDKTLGTTASTGGNGKLGGALASPGLAMTQQNSIGATYSGGVYIKSGTYLLSVTANGSGGKLTITQNGDSSKFFRIIGYGTNRLDFTTRPILQANANSVTCLEIGPSGGGGNSVIDFLEFQSAAFTSCRGIYNTNGGGNVYVRRCYLNTLSGDGCSLINSSNHRVLFCTAKGCTGKGFTFAGAQHVYTYGCVSTGNTNNGFQGETNGGFFIYCASARNGSDGFISVNNAINCASVGNTGANGNGFTSIVTCINCVAYGNAASGFTNVSGTGSNSLLNCAGGSNAGANGNYSTTEFPNTWVEGFISLSADPFTSSSTNDFSLNSTVGGGASLKSAGFGSIPSNTVSNPTSHLDVGSVQSAAAAGGAAGGRIFTGF